MLRYLLKRILLIIPTVFGIIAINFAVVQLAPGGPIQTVIAKVKAQSMKVGETPEHGLYRGMQGLDPQMVAQLRQQFGFDKPPLVRFFLMLRGYLTFNLGNSFFQGPSVLSLVWQRLPVSISTWCIPIIRNRIFRGPSRVITGDVRPPIRRGAII